MTTRHAGRATAPAHVHGELRQARVVLLGAGAKCTAVFLPFRQDAPRPTHRLGGLPDAAAPAIAIDEKVEHIQTPPDPGSRTPHYPSTVAR